MENVICFKPSNFWFMTWWHPWSKESREADWQRSDSRPVVEGAVAAVVLVGEERALDKDTWLGLETLVTSCVWLVVDDWRLRAPAPWKEVPLLKVLTTSICGRRVGQKRTNGCSETKTKWQHRLTEWMTLVLKEVSQLWQNEGEGSDGHGVSPSKCKNIICSFPVNGFCAT